METKILLPPGHPDGVPGRPLEEYSEEHRAILLKNFPHRIRNGLYYGAPSGVWIPGVQNGPGKERPPFDIVVEGPGTMPDSVDIAIVPRPDGGGTAEMPPPPPAPDDDSRRPGWTIVCSSGEITVSKPPGVYADIDDITMSLE